MTNRQIGLTVLAAVLLVAIGFGVAIAWHSRASPVVTPTAAVAVTPPTATASPLACRSVNGLPDHVCTPGFADPRVTQDNIHATICMSGYTTKVRPSTSYTNALKVKQITLYGYADTNLADYEEDHLSPLELGGHPTDPRNLWPEPRTGSDSATVKDRLENSLHAKVCAGTVTLVAAQGTFATDWESP